MNRTFALLLCLCAVVGLFAYARLGDQPSPNASMPPKTAGSRILFVPIGDFPEDKLESLAKYYRRRYNLEIPVLHKVAIESSDIDEARHQLIAEQLNSTTYNAFPEYAGDSKNILIGFTSEDIYPTSMRWKFAFGWRQGQPNVAVVSTARLSLPYTGDTWELFVQRARLRKIVTKDIGILYFGLPQSSDPKSVLYNQILGIEELDHVGDDF